jgi:preprotein translocase subunit SecA
MQSTKGIPVIGGVLNTLFGSRNERLVKKYTQRVESINALEPEIRLLTDAELRAKTDEFRQRIRQGTKADDLLVEVFAVAREAMDRSVGIRNIFNPHQADAFDPSQLPDDIRELYDATKAQMDAREPAEPTGEFLGGSEPQPGWLQVDIPVPLYNAVRDLYPESRPPFRSRPFDVQLIGAMVLGQGKIAEMKTGEGKTIVAPLACYLAALEGLSCHVVTVNDYLVQRDRDWTFPFFHAVGMTVGAIHPHHMQPEQVKRQMYLCDIVYGTTSEFGFDYLRDNMKRTVEQQVQRVRQFAVVDEVDSILIDEARTPLIISGPAHEDTPRYEIADKLARQLVELQKPWQQVDDKVQQCLRQIKGLEGDIRNSRDKARTTTLQQQLKEARAKLPDLEASRDQHTQYYEVEMDRKQAHVSHEGIEAAQKSANVGSFYIGENIDLPHLLQQAIRAHVVYERDRDYIIMPTDNPQTGRKEPSIVIVDTFTGRPMIGRQWSDGLHQAIEAKENVPIKQETQTVATVTIQNFFKMYERLAGMTGTADTEAQEFHDIYGLDVVMIPTNKPIARDDFEDTMFLNGKDKWNAIVDEIKAFHDVGRPVLVGTTSVEKSEMLAAMLQKQHNIKHNVLNAKQHEQESNIIENAGKLGAVMIATNMAGRGTDIKLSRITRDVLLDHWKRRGLAPKELTTDASDQQVRELVYRKVAIKELGLPKSEAQSMDFAELELRLLRKWTVEYTWIEDKKAESMSADDMRDALDEHGRFRLHRIAWVDSIENLGGLHVIGTERHESRRIDNQLRGRSGRQGDHGSSRFFVAFDDDLMKLFAGETTLKILSRLGMKEGDSIEHPMLTKSVERAQRKVEERNFHVRKNILEYDEVMEHQRQEFYGLRQRALEGQDIKGLIFQYIEESTADVAYRYLDKDYPAECVAEFAKEKLDCSIPFERLRNKDHEDLLQRIREDALEDIRDMTRVTLNEYMPADAPPEDVDVDSLARWIRTHADLEILPSELRTLDRHAIQNRIEDAAEKKIASTSLDGLERYLAIDYGAQQLIKWVRDRFEIEIPLADITSLETTEEVVELITNRANEIYERKEIETPVTYAIDMTSIIMQQSPDQAAEQLARWARTRVNLDWTPDTVRKTQPAQLKGELLKAAEANQETLDLEGEIDNALAREDNDALDAYLQERFDGAKLPDWLRALRGEARSRAIRGRIETLVRTEMVQFERTVLLEVLDPAWKDNLYAMDQIRDSIGFRAFSQKDPRIEYKREGAKQFETMLETVRDRVADYVFKMRMTPQQPQQQLTPEQIRQLQQAMAQRRQQGAGAQPPAQTQGRPAPQPRPIKTGSAPAPLGATTISGPGFSAPQQIDAPTYPAKPTQQTDQKNTGEKPAPKKDPLADLPAPPKPTAASQLMRQAGAVAPPPKKDENKES